MDTNNNEVNNKMAVCSSCGADIAKSAKSCPKCGAKVKKPFYKKFWFWIVVAIVVIVIAASSGKKGESSNSNSSAEQAQSQNSEQAAPSNEEQGSEPISYTEYDAATLINDLEGNALRASETYNGKYVQIKGKLSNIDSGGSYISIAPVNNDFTLVNIQCYVKDDTQKSVISGLNKDDVITVKGKIKDVGEIMGYSLDIDEIIK